MANQLSNNINNNNWNMTPFQNNNAKENEVLKTKTVTKLLRNNKEIPEWAADFKLVEKEWNK